MRKSTISVSNEEKEQLDNAKEVLFGTQEVPYGAAISELVDRVTEE